MNNKSQQPDLQKQKLNEKRRRQECERLEEVKIHQCYASHKLRVQLLTSAEGRYLLQTQYIWGKRFDQVSL